MEKLCHLNNRREKKTHSQILSEIYDLVAELAIGINVFVREKGFYRFQNETLALFKVVGVADLAVWHKCKKAFFEFAPSTVKKTLTGSGKAGKNEVAAALQLYVDRQEYKTDDESDAVAVGITYLIAKGYLKK